MQMAIHDAHPPGTSQTQLSRKVHDLSLDRYGRQQQHRCSLYKLLLHCSTAGRGQGQEGCLTTIWKTTTSGVGCVKLGLGK